ncbi:MAG: NUDIX hydrolase [Lactobacillaceae bacterium]|jgi:ADP-ribose pyrophosphatase|nr:NUDIX hydrolase [Lactobacillaceae bacterium]
MKENNLNGEILSEEEHFNGRIFNVVTRSIKTPDGLIVNRDVVLHGDAVAMIMPLEINGEIKYAIGNEYRAGLNAMRSSFPAGLINSGELPEQSALREASEEIGLQYQKAKLIYKISTSEGFTNETTYLMLLEDFVGSTQTHFDQDEMVHRSFLSLKELGEKITNGEITTAPAIIGFQYLTSL